MARLPKTRDTRLFPARRRALRLSFRARFSNTAVKALYFGSSAAIRASALSITFVALTAPLPTAAAIALADALSLSPITPSAIIRPEKSRRISISSPSG